MMRLCILFLVSALPLVGSCTQPRDTYQPAQIRIVSAQPCFTINDTEEARKSPPEIASVTVSKHNMGNSDMVWGVDLTAVTPHFILAPDQCMQYAAKIPDAVDVKAPEPLKLGEHYSVSINAFIKSPEGKPGKVQNRRYLRDFCLSRAPDGSLEVIFIPGRSGKPTWEICTPPANPVVIPLADPPHQAYKNAAIHVPHPALKSPASAGIFFNQRGGYAG